MADADWASMRSVIPLAVEKSCPVADANAAISSDPAACVVIAGADALVEVPFAAVAANVSTSEVIFMP